MKRSVVILAVFLGLAASVLAQVQGGTIGGTVQDEEGGVLPGVTVTLQGVDATRETVTGTDGGFRFLDLAPGPYKLTAALAGFSTIVQDSIVVAVGKTVDLRLTTKIAAGTIPSLPKGLMNRRKSAEFSREPAPADGLDLSSTLEIPLYLPIGRITYKRSAAS